MKPFLDPDLPAYDYVEPPRPANPVAMKLAEATCEMFDARMELVEARGKVPDYTGDLQAEFYYRTEQEAYNRAAEAYADALRAAMDSAGGV